jgi:hypothetical protein
MVTMMSNPHAEPVGGGTRYVPKGNVFQLLDEAARRLAELEAVLRLFPDSTRHVGGGVDDE